MSHAKNRSDGYAGCWDPQAMQPEPDKFHKAFPLDIPITKATTLIVSRGSSGYHWQCAVCKGVAHTDKWERPPHICEHEVFGFPVRVDANMPKDEIRLEGRDYSATIKLDKQ